MTAIIVTAHDDNLESKLAGYDLARNLPACTIDNGCLEILTPFGTSSQNTTSNYDPSAFVEQVHATSPGSKVLVVEAKSISWQDKYSAANYVKTLPGIEKISSISYSKIVMIIGMVLK